MHEDLVELLEMLIVEDSRESEDVALERDSGRKPKDTNQLLIQ